MKLDGARKALQTIVMRELAWRSDITSRRLAYSKDIVWPALGHGSFSTALLATSPRTVPTTVCLSVARCFAPTKLAGMSP
jgi:hypothetical protein